MIDEAFKNWFIGFSEGEASLSHASGGLPRFTLTQKNKNILEVIRDTLGFGKVMRHWSKLPDTWRYVVEKDENLNVLIQIFDGNLRTDFKREQFHSWLGLWNYNNPIRIAGREKERMRRQIAMLDPLKAQKARELTKKWNRKNRVQFNANKRKSWFKHREKNLVKHRERTIIGREMQRFVKESIELCLTND